MIAVFVEAGEDSRDVLVDAEVRRDTDAKQTNVVAGSDAARSIAAVPDSLTLCHL